MDCDVFVLHANSDKQIADRVGSALRRMGLRAAVGLWDRHRPPKCRAAVLIATGAIVEIEGAIGSAIWHRIPIFAFRLGSFQPRGNLQGYLKQPSLKWIDGISRPIDLSLRDLTQAIDLRLNPPPLPSPPPEYEEVGPIYPADDVIHDDSPALNPSPSASRPSIAKPPEPPPTVSPPVDISAAAKRAGGVLADVKPLRGFFSYSRQDDRLSDKALSTLREKISGELGMQLGGKVEVWQDTHDIRGGSRWKLEIRKGIASSVFFIPIVTPNSVNSENCKFELDAFLDQERALQRTDLIFPISYVDVPQLACQEIWENDDRLALIGERQYREFADLRFLPFNDGKVKKFIFEFSRTIVEALRKRVEPPDD
jgi:TIR domain